MLPGPSQECARLSFRVKPHLDLRAAARQAMLDHGFRPDFGPEVQGELATIGRPAATVPPGGRDLRDLRWSSIDEVESRDLDQIEVAEPLDGGGARIRVAIADVDALVPAGSAVDAHAGWNTTSVYTAAAVFPMLPEVLSTGLTSLGEDVDRPAMVVEVVVAADGSTGSHDVYPALVRNRAQLDYDSIGRWLEGEAPAPAKVAASAELADQLRRQDAAAQALRALRHRRGALPLETLESKPVLEGDAVTALEVKVKNRARQLIEDFMVAANVAMASFLAERHSPWVARVVRIPDRWGRIVDLARQLGESLPAEPSAAALAGFLDRQRVRDPVRYPDLSLSIIKLLGSGEYVLGRAGQPSEGHFGLAVDDYTHSTAPNRRYADLVTQRLLKAALKGGGPAYPDDALSAIARRCTEREDEARRVERQVHKQAAALLLVSHVGERYDALVTGASPKGTWVRVLRPPVEGRVVRGQAGLDVGDRVRVRLVAADPARGFIDFARE
ncbi:MAG: ribonuclease II [Acidobacteria bacterium]|nr:MAG: ribonuclease II [Acidobacteriota bacterium]